MEIVDKEILNKLHMYCSELIGEESTVKHSREKKIKRKKRNLDNPKGGKATLKEVVPETKLEHSKSLKGNQRVTKDGFKIVSEIPPDSPDVSDAFCSDFEDDSTGASIYSASSHPQVNAGVKQTEDGFKIVSNIVADDSDVSDAFESDFDESEWIHEVQQKHNKKKKSKTEHTVTTPTTSCSKQDSVIEPELQNIKKPLMKLIEDFGMQNNLYLNTNSEPCLRRQICSKGSSDVKKYLPQKDMNIIDYSSRRGKKKNESDIKSEVKNKIEDSAKQNSKALEDAFKKARFEVFKFGLNAFEKHEQKNAKIELAIKLGAKPPKKKAMNYKKLIEERKSQKKNEIVKREEKREMGLPVMKPTEKNNKKRDVNINPQIGKFRGGVLSLSRKEIENISGKKD